MGFTDAVRSSMRQYATFEGRARRSEFWYFYLFYFLVALAGGAVVLVVALLTVGLSSAGGNDPAGWAIAIYLVAIGLWMLSMFALYIPIYAVWARRLHDMGQTGHWLWLNLVSLGIVPLIMAFMDSERGPNRWGPDPKAAERPGLPYGYPQQDYPQPGYGYPQPGQLPPSDAPAAQQPVQQPAQPEQMPPPPSSPSDSSWAQPPGQPGQQR